MPRQDWSFYVPQRVRSSFAPRPCPWAKKNPRQICGSFQSMFWRDFLSSHTSTNIRDEGAGSLPRHLFLKPTLFIITTHTQSHKINQQRSGGAFSTTVSFWTSAAFFFHSSIKVNTQQTQHYVYAKRYGFFYKKSRRVSNVCVCVLASIFFYHFLSHRVVLPNTNNNRVVCVFSLVCHLGTYISHHNGQVVKSRLKYICALFLTCISQ